MKKILLFTTIILLAYFSSKTNAQWFSQNNPFQNSTLNDIIALDENTTIAVGAEYTTTYEGIILKTTDGGETWLNKSQDTIGYYSSIHFINADTGWIVGEIHLFFSSLLKIFKTTDAGDTWISDTIGTGGVSSVHFVDQYTGWAVGTYYDGDRHVGTMFKTTDGGLNWVQQFQLGETLQRSVYFVNNDTGWVVGSDIFKTTNGGENWVAQLGTNIYWNSVYFVDEFTGWAAGTGCGGTPCQGEIFKTIDGGENWISQLVEVNNTLYDIYFIDENIGWAVGTGGIILKTTDGGENWISQPSGTSNNLYSVHFADENTGWVVGENGTILKTTNGGNTIPVELTSFTANAQFGNVELNWSTATETNNMMFEIERASSSTMPVQDWRIIGYVEGKGTTTERQEYTYTDRNVTVGKYFYRLKQIDYDGTFEYSAEIEVDAAPESFSLEQNYPNPFNPSTTIKYSIPVSEFVSLKFYDVLGNEVASLVNEEKPAGSYEIDFNASDFSSGVYFYKIQAGDFVETKKMILLR